MTGGTLAFGASTRNGLAMPGPAVRIRPDRCATVRWTRLDAAGATWKGVIVGYTRSERSITGDTSLKVRFDDLAPGLLRFSGLDDDNSLWEDEELEYTVRVEKNEFGNQDVPGADAGDVTGAFFGRSHEGIGGTRGVRKFCGNLDPGCPASAISPETF